MTRKSRNTIHRSKGLVYESWRAAVAELKERYNVPKWAYEWAEGYFCCKKDDWYIAEAEFRYEIEFVAGKKWLTWDEIKVHSAYEWIIRELHNLPDEAKRHFWKGTDRPFN